MTIFEFRADQGWTQREMADRWEICIRSIKDWESGRRAAGRFYRERLKKLSKGAITDWPPEKEGCPC